MTVTVTVYGCVILISFESCDFLSPFSDRFSSILTSIEMTFKTRFDHISLEVRQICPAACRIFKSLFGDWKCAQTRS